MICDDWQWYEKTSYDAYTGNVTGLVAIFHISFHICFCWGTKAFAIYKGNENYDDENQSGKEKERVFSIALLAFPLLFTFA